MQYQRRCRLLMSPRPARQTKYRSASPCVSASCRRHDIASNTATVQIYALGPSGPCSPRHPPLPATGQSIRPATGTTGPVTVRRFMGQRRRRMPAMANRLPVAETALPATRTIIQEHARGMVGSANGVTRNETSAEDAWPATYLSGCTGARQRGEG